MRFSSLTFLSLIAAGAIANPLDLRPRATLSSFAGTNAYWLPFLTSDADVAATFSAVQAAGLKVLRTWGFQDSTTCTGVHFQCWASSPSSSTPSINTGSDGLQRLDAVVAAAEKYGVKLVIPFVNNWGDYGGMDVYVSKLGLGSHSEFYTSTKAQEVYMDYVKTLVERYKSSDAILAWQLANEPRCNGCSTSIITTWAASMSAYIKSLDPNKLVSLGDEGFFNRSSSTSYPYQGGEGIDFEENLKITTLDYGIAHMYPSNWGQTYEWGNQWISDHAEACRKAGKSCVIEEYGVPVKGATRDHVVPVALVRRAIDVGVDMFWQFGLTLSTGKSSDDGFTIYTDDSDFQTLVVDWANSR
ncbi:putative mannan endo-1,4-beta-mannosidase A [Sphaerosporella brunnea]|uniref:mannan endo-1,4-beta-mannosidase n=1 Tax=Sphaerosporella brunnea TaxID=1250544 RepID=A0A5J5FAV9_9PEZI|nr:putative mannan endo-1,4-beta-mannosidase A [Sphaerosporella brunnea]